MIATKSIEAAVEAIREGEGDDTVTHLSLAELGLVREQSSEIQIRFYYYNNGRNKAHYLSVQPVSRDGNVVSLNPMNGVRRTLSTVARKSAKASREARESVTAELVERMIAATT